MVGSTKQPPSFPPPLPPLSNGYQPIDTLTPMNTYQSPNPTLQMLIWGGLASFFLVCLILGAFLANMLYQLPDVGVLANYRPSESSRLFDSNGNLIANIQGDEDRAVISLNDMSPYIKKAVLGIEDYRYYEHNGVDVRGTLRAFLANMSADDHVQGGSTITQQLVKNLFLSPEKSYKRKISEAYLAIKVEKRYSKDTILEMYLNQVYFGNQSYGIEKAARRYFKKAAKDLTLYESAMLAGLLKAPEGLSPYAFPKASARRTREVLDNMVTYGYITPAQRRLALAEHVVLNSREAKHSKYPYFVSHVIRELEELYGRELLRRGGLTIYTTLDPQAQEVAEKLVEDFVKAHRGGGVNQGALVALDTETGNIKALVGGVDFEHNQFNSATMARRAVGSTFKPFVFLTGLRMEKITPRTPITDKPISYAGWAPHNWDGKYMGAMNVRTALVQSRNTTTVQIGMKVGVDQVIKTARMAGIKSHIDNNPSSLLGSSGVSPLELVTGYSTFARGGIYIKPSAIRKVENNRGEVLSIETPSPKRVFQQDYVAALVDILIDVVEKGTGRNAILKDRVVAGKTGTTDDVRDIWFMGFTPDLVCGVWFGNRNNTPLHGVFSFNSAQVWHDFAEAYFKLHPTPPHKFFIASDDYAAKTGLVHLMDPQGVAAAKLRIKNYKEPSLNDTAGGSLLNPEALDTQATDATTTTPATSTTPSTPKPTTAPVAPTAPQAPINNPETPTPPSVNPETPTPPIPTSPDEAKAKYRRWDRTLDDMEKRLDN